MNTTRLLTAAAATAAAGVAGLMGAAIASADDDGATVQNLGQQGQLVDGGNVQGWTVGNLQPSTDAIPYQPGGALWEATATDQVIAGGAIPFIPNFSARAANGDDYRALFQVPTAQGVNPSGLAQGQSTTGKLYFDVTGATPNSVVYGSGGQDQLIWVEPPPSAEGTAGYSGTGQSGTLGYGGQSSASPTGAGAAAATPATSPAATGQSATPAPAAAAADDVHGAATAAQPQPTTAPLDVHDTTVAPTATPSGAASAPASSSGSAQTAQTAQTPTAAPSPAAASAVPTTVPPAAPAKSGSPSS